jgi:hypothetical protein
MDFFPSSHHDEPHLDAFAFLTSWLATIDQDLMNEIELLSDRDQDRVVVVEGEEMRAELLCPLYLGLEIASRVYLFENASHPVSSFLFANWLPSHG